MKKIGISVCIATCDRPLLLERLLNSIASQNLAYDCPGFEIIVVDNGADREAEKVVRKFERANADMLVTYDIQPQKNISLTRNLALSHAKGDYIAFIDDDEYASKNWLSELYLALTTTKGDAVFGPVLPVYPPGTPDWIIESRVFESYNPKDHQQISIGRTGNALMRSEWIKEKKFTFNPELGITGGEDTDFFNRMIEKNGFLYWAKKAVVYEEIENSRLNIWWIIKRAFRYGQTYSEHKTRNLGVAYKVLYFLLRFAVFGIILLSTIPLSLFFGFSHGVKSFRYAFLQLGHASVAFPFRYEEYKRRSSV
ncbi:Succinoglycan biosynthesis protein ExoM [Chitinispirillum alkaliphilum]|nr:Succinoglycan biosynthesis protein ExoM [Chitinispirillum alkaliphilum]